MSERVIVFGDVTRRHEVERLLAERYPGIHVESVGRRWDLVERAVSEGFDAVLLLKGGIAEHEQQVATVAALRRDGFRGRILFEGVFLTEKQDALGAGADFAYDPDQHPTENVVAASLRRPRVAADHPYLRAMFVGEWAEVVTYGDGLPDGPLDLVVASTASHSELSFWETLVRDREGSGAAHVVIVEDGGGEDVCGEALATGLQPYVILADEGVARLQEILRTLLREVWLAGMNRT